MDAGGPLQASVRLLSGGDRDENGDSVSQEVLPQNRAQQLQLGRQYSLYTLVRRPSSHATRYAHHLQTRHLLRTQCTYIKVYTLKTLNPISIHLLKASEGGFKH